MHHPLNHRILAPALALALAGALAWSAPSRAEEPQPAPQPQQEEAAPTPQSTTTVVGLRVVIDPETLQPISVHPGQKVQGADMSPAMMELLSTRVEAIEITRVNGVKRADLGLSALVPLVVTVDGEGKVRMDHVDVQPLDEATATEPTEATEATEEIETDEAP
jgi:hypothetical protein